MICPTLVRLKGNETLTHLRKLKHKSKNQNQPNKKKPKAKLYQMKVQLLKMAAL